MKLDKIDSVFKNGIERDTAYMLATSHEYKEPNQDAAIKLVSNYKWEKRMMKLSDLQGINKPIKNEKVFDIAKTISKSNLKPLMVVDKFHGITPQTKGKKILLDGHHRQEACKFKGIDEVPVYYGKYTGKAEKSIDEIIEKKSEEILMCLEKEAKVNDGVEFNPLQKRIIENPSNNMILAHPVGSGKTLSGLAKFEKLKEEGRANKALIVAPASLRHNYANEGIGKFTDSKANIIGNKGEIAKGTAFEPNPDSDYNIVSYEMFRKNPKAILQATGADTIIADEIHKVKNDNTSTLNSFYESKDDYKNFIGLTGSVISNKISDLYNLVDLASSGEHKLGPTKKEFDERYLRRSNAKKYSDLKKEKRPIVGFNHKRELQKELSKYIDYADVDDIRDIAKIPKKDLKINKVPVSRQQAKYYKQLLQNNPNLKKLIINKRLETFGDDEIARAFSDMIEARKLMNSVGSVVPGIDLKESAKITPKTKRILDDMEKHIKTTGDGQAILLTNLVNGGVDVLEAGLKDRGIEYGRFIGKGNKGVTEEVRQQDVKDYNDRKKRVMIISGAGAEGISLGDTTWEGVLDGHYNPERMNQMEARGIRSFGLSHRPEKDRKVEVNRYIATMPKSMGVFKSPYKTPDEVIYEIANTKNQQNQLLFDLLRKSSKTPKY